MHRNLSLQGLFSDTTQLESGLIVPTHAATDLIKAEAKKLARQDNNKATFFSRFGQNLIANGAREKPMGTPNMPLLYEAARKSFIDAIIIQSRVDQQKRIWQRATDGKTKQLGFKVVHERHDDVDYKVTKGDKERCREMEALLLNPTPVEDTWLFPNNIRPHTGLKDLISVLTRTELIIDRKCLLRYKRSDGKGYAAFHFLPGETIKNVDEAIRKWAQDNETDRKVGRNTVEKMSYATDYDIARASHVQMIDGMVTAAFTPEEITVHISNPSDQLNRWGYGTSRLEMSLDISTTLLMAFGFNQAMFRTNYPEQVLAISGDYDKEGLQAFKQQILGEAGGVGNNWRLPIIPAGDIDNFKIESIKLRETPKDMLFDQMIELAINLKAAAYGCHPSTLNLTAYSGTSGQNTLGGNNTSGEIEFSKEHGLIPSLLDMCEWLTNEIVHPRYDDLKVILEGLEPDDEKQNVDIRTSRVSKWITKNECRMEEGGSPIGFYLPPEKYNKLAEDSPDKKRYDTNPWNYPADVAVTNYLGVFAQADQAQQEQDQGDDDQGDDQGDDQQPDDSDQYYKSMQKSRRHSSDKTSDKRETKYLNITLGD
jgi:hypothetical protein